MYLHQFALGRNARAGKRSYFLGNTCPVSSPFRFLCGRWTSPREPLPDRCDACGAPEVRGFLLAHPTDLTPTLAAWEAALAAGVRFAASNRTSIYCARASLNAPCADSSRFRSAITWTHQQLVLMLHTSGNGMGDLSNQQYVRGVLGTLSRHQNRAGHMGRYLQADEFFRFADSGLLDYPGLYLEMSLATLPAVYARVARVPAIHRRLLFGTDLPFGLITGIEAWSERAGAIFVTRDTYPWTDQATQQASPVRPEQLTYNTYHVLRAFKTALDALGLPSAEEAAIKQAVFRKNAESLFAAEAPCVSKNTLSTALALPGSFRVGPESRPEETLSMSDEPRWAHECQELARAVRGHCLRMTHHGKSGHVGSMLSMAELVSVLYQRILRVDAQNPAHARSRSIHLEQGAWRRGHLRRAGGVGLFPVAWLMTYYCDDGKLMGHISHHVPGVEFSTGSLGHGLPVACGMALAGKRPAGSIVTSAWSVTATATRARPGRRSSWRPSSASTTSPWSSTTTRSRPWGSARTC